MDLNFFPKGLPFKSYSPMDCQTAESSSAESDSEAGSTPFHQKLRCREFQDPEIQMKPCYQISMIWTLCRDVEHS